LGLLSLTALFPNGLLTDVSATHARRKLQFEQILDPKSVALRVEKALGLLSLPCTAFSLTTFSSAVLEIIIVTIPVIRITGIVTIIISNIMQVTSSIKN
jgi:hypothetical protein